MNLAQIALVVACFMFNIHRAVAEDVFIVTNKYCITNSTSAITFNTDVENTDPSNQPVSSFYPTIKKITDDSFQCDFEDDCLYQDHWRYSTDWRIINSQNGPINHIITDRRWEAFPLYKSKFIVENQKTHLVSKINNGHLFEISVSIRAKQDGHIFLCNGEYPTNSSCYWILIGYKKGTKSGIRQCAANEIIENEILPLISSPCKTVHDDKDTPAVLSEKAWIHFKISKHDNKLEVWKGNEKFLYFEDSRFPITPNSLIIHSKKVEALWKIHDYHYLYTVEEGNSSLGPPGSLKSQSCISMYIAMCKECSLTVSIGLNEDLARETFTAQNTEWKKIQMRYILITDEAPILYISRNIESGRSGFWAIDDIRFCSENDFRFLKSSEENVPCEKIDIRDGQILNVKREKVDLSNKPNVDCPEETFGRFCVPCKIFDNTRPYCEGFKYCENSDQETECRCTSGYMDQCAKHCPRDMYGHGCQKICGSCENNCNHINGYCTPCWNPYIGPRCDIHSSQVRNLAQTVYPRKILLSWQPPLAINGTIDSYNITYKLVRRRGCENSTDRDEKTTVSSLETAIELNNLYPFSIYYISIRAITRASPGEYRNITAETGISDELSQSERMTIELFRPLDTNVFVYLNQTPCNKLEGPVYIRFKASCSNEWCSTSTVKYTLSVNWVRLKNLFPFSQYTVIMEVSRDNKTKWIETSSKRFTTEEAFPGPIASKPVVYTRDEHSISLRWKPPYPPTGIIKQYKLVYTEQRQLRALRETVNAETCKIWLDYHCATITRGIENGAAYNLQIYARNEIGAEFQSVYDKFSIINMGLDSDPVYGLEGVWIKNNGLKVSWYHPNNTIGELKGFRIKIPKGFIYNELISVNSNNYSLTYTHTIPETNFEMCSKYEIVVATFSEHANTGRAEAILSISTPPRISINKSELLDSIKSGRYTITVAIPLLAQDKRIHKNIYILISDSTITNVLDDFEESVQNRRENIGLISFHLVFLSIRTNLLSSFEIGNENSSAVHKQIYRNPPLHPGKNYCVTYLFVYNCTNSATMERVQKCIITKDDNTVSDSPSTAGLNTLLILFATILGLA